MANPSYVVQMNVSLYNDTLTNVVVLGTNTDGGQHVVLWDNLSAYDKELMDQFMTHIPVVPVVPVEPVEPVEPVPVDPPSGIFLSEAPSDEPTSGAFAVVYHDVPANDKPIKMWHSPAELIFKIDGTIHSKMFNTKAITKYGDLYDAFVEYFGDTVTMHKTPMGFSAVSKITGSHSMVALITPSVIEMEPHDYQFLTVQGRDVQFNLGVLRADENTLWEKFQTTRSPNGAMMSEVIPVRTVLPFHAGPIAYSKEVPNSYYDAKQKSWRYKADASPICS